MFGKDTKEPYIAPIEPNIGDIWIDKNDYSIIVRIDKRSTSSLYNIQVSLKADNNQSNAFYYKDLPNLFFYGGKNENDVKSSIIYHQINIISESING